MADNTWRFEFVDSTQQQGIESGIIDTLGSGTAEKSNTKKSKKGFDETFTNKIDNTLVQQTVISPLNTVTGGLASPLYRSAKSIIKGASIGATLGGLGATVAIMAVSGIVDKIQQRMQKLETQVQDMNNTDNALIRAGSVSKATYYSYNIFGIKKTTNRS